MADVYLLLNLLLVSKLLLKLLQLLLTRLTLESLVHVQRLFTLMSPHHLTLTDHLFDHACLVSASGPSRVYTDTLLTIIKGHSWSLVLHGQVSVEGLRRPDTHSPP